MKDVITIKDVLSSKLAARMGFKKGTLSTSPQEIIEILNNGAIVEFKAQEVRQAHGVKIQVIECRIYFPE
jgi:hypothetical protein